MEEEEKRGGGEQRAAPELSLDDRLLLSVAFRRLNTTGEQYQRRQRQRMFDALIMNDIGKVEQLDCSAIAIRTRTGRTIVICADD